MCQNQADLRKNLLLSRDRCDVVYVLMAAQTCLWKLTSVTWEVYEMFLKWARRACVRGRKMHNEMSWVISKEVMEGIKAKQDAMSSFYTRALNMSQQAMKNILDFVAIAKQDMITMPSFSSLPVIQDVNSALLQKWAEKSEEEACLKEYSELTKQTGFQA